MRRDISLSIFFPAFNEAANIHETIVQATAVAQKLTHTYEIIVVDDGSSDDTAAITKKLAAKDPHIQLVQHKENRGYGAAVWSGIQAARNDYIFFTDADLQFDLAELALLWEHIPDYAVVLGYRAKRRDPFMRLLNAKGWNMLIRLLFGLKVKDVDCAFKLLDRLTISSLPIKSRGAMMSAELLINLQRRNVPFKEVAVTHLPRKQGSPTGAKPSVILLAFRELFQAYRGELGNPTYKQLIRFALIGTLNTAVDLGLFALFVQVSPYFGGSVSGRVGAKALSFGLAALASFFLHRQWTFRRKDRIKLNEILRFYITNIGGLLLNTVTMYLLLRFTLLPPLFAALVATAISFLWNYSLSRYWVFKQSSRPKTKVQL